MTRPTTTGSTPDFSNPTHAPAPRTKYTSPTRTGTVRMTNTQPTKAAATSSGTTCSAPVYTVAITTSETTSSTTALVSRNARTRSGKRGPTSASRPSANAVSVDIAMPQPPSEERPALKAT